MSVSTAAVGRAGSASGRLAVLVLTTLLAVTGVLGTFVPEAAAATNPCATPVVNKVACENTQTGTDAWQVSPDASIEGFATEISTNVGGRVDFKVRTASTNYRVDVYRLGWYGGAGGRLVGSVRPTWTGTQPDCLRDAPTGLVDCGNWTTSASWTVPATAVSGVYTAVLHRLDSAAENQITFVVRDDSSTSDVVFQTSDTTWAAYNTWGGASMYTGDGPGPGGRAYKVSYNRPLASQELPGQVFYAEYPMIRFMESNGYDVSYIAGVDTDRNPALVRNHRAFLSVGHDEYWSGPQRTNVENAKAAGVDLAFFSGNEMWWRIRWESSLDATRTDHRTVVCYKDSLTGAPLDPTGDWTGTWRDPRFARPAGVEPENALIGQQFKVNGLVSRADSLSVPAEFGRMRLWRNTAVANQAADATYTFGAGTLGYEWDSDYDNGFRPAGLAHLSETTVDIALPDVLQDDYGVSYAPGTATHNLSLYRDQNSGALVFGAGTVQWSWGLDDEHDGAGDVANTPMKQATVNLFADMGIQPASLRTGLVAASASTDTTAPTVVVKPTSGAAVGSPVTITGTATDATGVVAGVEVSVDGGTSWHPAVGRSTWSYTFTPTVSGQLPVLARAVDDSARLSAPVTSSATVAQRTCPCGLFATDAAPPVPATTDASAVELGVRFQSSVAGYVSGVRFYKGAGNTGTHTGSLWTTSGQLLATGTFTGETGTGWQTLTFPSAVPLTAGTAYVASYYAPAGHYAATSDYFSRDLVNEPLLAQRDTAASPAGVYRSGGAGFPTASYRATNYWVDPVFVTSPPPDTTAPLASASSPLAGSTSVSRTTTVQAVFNEPVQASTVSIAVVGPTGSSVAGTVAHDPGTRTSVFTPTEQLAAGTVYRVTVSGAKDIAGNVLVAPLTWSFTTMSAPGPAGACPCSIWDDTAVPSVITVGDPAAIELGVQFRTQGDGSITGIRFYKGGQNTGTHTGSLWTSSGQRLATATFTAESSSGWQQVTFAEPVPVTAGTTYVASYHTDAGYYSATAGGLAQDVVSGPLTALAGNQGTNGVYVYGGSAFPSRASSGTNYWVDVTYAPARDTTAPTVVSTTPVADGRSVQVDGTVTATFSELTSGATITLSQAGTLVAGSTAQLVSTRSVRFTPSSPLVSGTTYTATVTGAVDSTGNQLAAPYSWSFTTSGASACPCTVFGDDAPTVAASTDASSIELGVRLQSTVDGYVAGVRFYKGAGNTGTHTGSLWSESGELLATGTFTGETSSGWQTLTFATPVAVSAGETVIASYHAPNGHYTGVADFFTSDYGNPPLRALASTGDRPNGLYAVSGSTTFPTATYRAATYYVDAVFTTTAPSDTTSPTVVSTTPGNGFTGIPTTSLVQFTFSEPVVASTATVQVQTSSGQVISGVVSQVTSKILAFRATQALPAASTITATISGTRDSVGNVMAGAVSTSFTTASGAAATCPCTLVPTSSTPRVGAANDTAAVELGVRFTADVDGFVSGIRYYRGAGNSGTHTGSLWTADGTRMATATFANESTSGWQQVLFATPVPVTANTTYVASYHTESGRYSYDANAFSSVGLDRAPLHAPVSGAVRTGAYAYGAGGFPGQGSNTYYYVDVLFSDQPTTGAPPVTSTPTDSSAPTVVSSTPTTGATGVRVGTQVSVTFSEKVAAAGLQFTLTGPSGPVSTVVGLDATGTVATASPSAPLQGSTVYTASIQATDVAGNPMTAPTSWTFTTEDATPPTVTGRTPAPSATAVPVTTTVATTFSEAVDPSTVTVGVAGPSGAVGGAVALDATGTRATWTSSAPLAGSTVHTVTVNAKDLAGNAQSPATWTFTTADVTPPTVVSVTPVQGSAATATGAPLTATFSEDVAGTGLTVTVVPAGGAAVPVTSAYSSATRTVTVTPTVLLAGNSVYTATVTAAKDLAGNPLAAPVSWTFTTTAAGVFRSTDTPPAASVTSTTATEVGMRFQTSAAGWITSVRLYKGTGATGTHVGSLWNAAGQRLASVQFSAETATGWQTATFARPVQVAAATVYTVSYTAPAGRWSSTPSYFGAAKVNGQLTALANGSGGNGVTGAAGTMPRTSAAGANLWVDVVFTTSTPPGTVATDTVAPTVTAYAPTGGGQAWIGTAPTFTMSEPVSGIVVRVTGPTGATVRGTLTYAPATLSGRFAISDALGLRTTYSVTVSGGKDAAGNTMAPVTWLFTTM